MTKCRNPMRAMVQSRRISLFLILEQLQMRLCCRTQKQIICCDNIPTECLEWYKTHKAAQVILSCRESLPLFNGRQLNKVLPLSTTDLNTFIQSHAYNEFPVISENSGSFEPVFVVDNLRPSQAVKYNYQCNKHSQRFMYACWFTASSLNLYVGVSTFKARSYVILLTLLFPSASTTTYPIMVRWAFKGPLWDPA